MTFAHNIETQSPSMTFILYFFVIKFTTQGKFQRALWHDGLGPYQAWYDTYMFGHLNQSSIDANIYLN